MNAQTWLVVLLLLRANGYAVPPWLLVLMIVCAVGEFWVQITPAGGWSAWRARRKAYKAMMQAATEAAKTTAEFLVAALARTPDPKPPTNERSH